jgi:hypothetical protein
MPGHEAQRRAIVLVNLSDCPRRGRHLWSLVAREDIPQL